MRAMGDDKALRALVEGRLSAPVPDAVRAIGTAVGDARGPGVAAVLAYGSALRGVPASDTLIDLYVLTDRPDAISPNRLSRAACRLLPPNVYYAEATHEGATVRAKCAVLPLDVFERKVAPQTDNPYFWARFAQPSALLHAHDADIAARVEAAVATAIARMVQEGRRLAGTASGSDTDPLRLWVRALTATYATELRSEREDRARQIVGADESWYRETAALVPPAGDMRSAAGHVWLRRRVAGKLLSVLRLVKAAFTFSGGADYIAWKIERHSGVPVELTDWQRRHPILAALTLIPKLYRKGAFR